MIINKSNRHRTSTHICKTPNTSDRIQIHKTAPASKTRAVTGPFGLNGPDAVTKMVHSFAMHNAHINTNAVTAFIFIFYIHLFFNNTRGTAYTPIWEH